MRMHEIVPWPSAVFQPSQKQEKLRKAKEAEQKRRTLALQGRLIPPSRDEDEDDDPPNKRTDILA
jgi:hypothetical protein